MTFLVPMFGLLWGAVFLGEPVTIVKVAACTFILAGTWLVTAHPA